MKNELTKNKVSLWHLSLEYQEMAGNDAKHCNSKTQHKPEHIVTHIEPRKLSINGQLHVQITITNRSV